MASVERHSQFPLLLQVFNLGANVLNAVEVAQAAFHGETGVLDRRLRGHGRAAAQMLPVSHAAKAGVGNFSGDAGQKPHRPCGVRRRLSGA